MRALLITLGGSKYPSAKALKHEAFSLSSQTIAEILTDPEAPLIRPGDHLCLFDDDRSWPEQLVTLRDWLKALASPETEEKPSDLIIHYVGHGSFKTNSLDYYLTINKTDDEIRAEMSISLSGLQKVLKIHAVNMRVIIMVDACFAAAAWRDLQSGEIETKVRAQVGELIEREEVPGRGLAVLCSSERYETSSAKGENGVTQFTDALTTALRSGSNSGGERLPLNVVMDLMMDVLNRRYADPVRPVLLAPRSGSASVEKHPLFPNRAVRTVAPYLESVPPELRTKLDTAVHKFLTDLATEQDPIAIEGKLSELSNVGRKQIAEAAAHERSIRRPNSAEFLAGLDELERFIDSVSPKRRGFLLSLRNLGDWLNPGHALRRSAKLASLVADKNPVSPLMNLASSKEEWQFANLEITTERAANHKSRSQLEQLYFIASEMLSKLGGGQQEAFDGHLDIASAVRERAQALVSERVRALAEVIKAKENQAARLDNLKAGNILMIQAVDSLMMTVSHGFAEAKDAALLLAELAAEKKQNQELWNRLLEALAAMRVEIEKVRALHDRVRGVEAA